MIEELQHVIYKEDADDLMYRLFVLVEKLDGLGIVLRVKKEIREINERKGSLSDLSKIKKSQAKIRAIVDLESTVSPCKKCGSKMVVREGNGTYFLGCSMFPNCWSRRWLTKEQLDRINIL